MVRGRKSSQADLIDSCPGNETVVKGLMLVWGLMEMCVCVCVIALFKAAHVWGQLELCGSPYPRGLRCGLGSTPATVLPCQRRRIQTFASRLPN